MKEFFHGWRRRAGVATLVLACVIAGGWMHCENCRNGVSFPLFERQHAIYAVDGKIVWMGMQRMSGVWLLASDDAEDMIDMIMDFDSKWDIFSEYQDFSGDSAIRRWAVSVWSIVLPLTLLSACLILWKPRKAK